MSIVLNPDKDLIAIKIMFVEEKTRNGSSKFHFINSKEEYDTWVEKGYLTVDETDQFKNNSTKPEPGMPVKTHDPTKLISVLKTWWSPITWKEHNKIAARCLKQNIDKDGNRVVDFDNILWRDIVLKSTLKKWDLKDGAGKDILITEDVVDNLVPEVAGELLRQFEKVTGDQE